MALDEVLDVEMFALANVNVRAGPTAQTEKLVTISNGDPVAVTGKTGDWFQIALADGRTGYILGRYLGLGAPAPEPPPGPTPTEIELAFWDAVKDTANPAELGAYLTQYPAGRFAALANARLGALRAEADAQAAAQARVDQEQAVWDIVKESTQVAELEGYLLAFPDGRYVQEARLLIEELNVPPPVRVPTGDLVWERTFGGAENDGAWSVAALADGGLAVAGYTESKGAGERDAWVLRLDGAGNVVWERTFGGAEDDRAFSVVALSNGDLAVAGQTSS